MANGAVIFLFAGSFNPVHAAHKAAVEWALTDGGADEVWVVVSPQNPLKDSTQMAPLESRVAMAKLVFDNIARVRVTDFEKNLPAPHYTIDAVHYLMERYPDKKFKFLCGTDILEELPKWHCSGQLQSLIEFVEYPRTILPVSSTEVRGGEKQHLLDDKVRQYIAANNLYANHLEVAKRLYAQGKFGEALNELDLCDSEQAQTLKEMIGSILAFRNTDIYNP